jgi:hypothetical protein
MHKSCAYTCQLGVYAQFLGVYKRVMCYAARRAFRIFTSNN